ncbi:MAG: hypothetical protein Q8P57_00800 [Candidatus Pacearchaeota archaeon]|nr:hypothetical protein [Candidatus Pacearchaeota archaeon]
MKNRKIWAIISLILILINGGLNFASSQIISGDSTRISAEYITLFPGEEKTITLEIKNDNNYDIEDVSIKLLLNDLNFISIGNSEKTESEIREDDKETFVFKLKASRDIIPGDYNIPYKLRYGISNAVNGTIEREGSFGLRVSALTELDFSIRTENAIVGERGKITLEIINKGLGEIRFVSVDMLPDSGYTLLSSSKEYIGTIDSDDSDFATFDVLFKSTKAILNSQIRYKDFDNIDQNQIISLPIKVYSRENALEIGLISESKTKIYIGMVILVIILWYIYRKIKKRKKRKKGI